MKFLPSVFYVTTPPPYSFPFLVLPVSISMLGREGGDLSRECFTRVCCCQDMSLLLNMLITVVLVVGGAGDPLLLTTLTVAGPGCVHAYIHPYPG